MPSTTLNDIWSAFDKATKSRSPLNLLQFASIGVDGAPQVRTVVLRRYDGEAATLSFTTDVRSQKIAEIRADPRVSFLGYDSEASIQYRASGTAIVVTDETEKLTVWHSLKGPTREMFNAPVAPSTVINGPADGQSVALEEREAFQHFALVTVTVTRLERLKLTSAPHERVAFDRVADQWKQQWLAP